MKLDNAVLVTHKGCMDGSTCALVFLAAGGKKENVYFTFPNHEDSDEIVSWLCETHAGPILVADVSISYALAKKLDSRNHNLMILDHHKTANALAEFSWCEIEKQNKRAGGLMLWDYLRPYTPLIPGILEDYAASGFYDLRSLVDAADDHDRWININPKSSDLAMFHDFVGQELFVERFLANPLLVFTPAEKYALDVVNKKRDLFIERKVSEAFYRMIDVGGKQVKVAVVECGDHQSFVGNYLCENVDNPADVAVMINSRAISFRGSSKCPIDLSKVAKMNGGGGHAKASATSIGNVLGGDFVESMFERIKWG